MTEAQVWFYFIDGMIASAALIAMLMIGADIWRDRGRRRDQRRTEARLRRLGPVVVAEIHQVHMGKNEQRPWCHLCQQANGATSSERTRGR
jgi:hypothetical protein